MKIKKYLSLIVILLSVILLSSCDYSYSYSLEVENSTDDTIIVNYKFYNFYGEEDKIFFDTIISGDTKEIIIIDAGICGRDYHPPRGENFFDFEYFNIYKEDSVLVQRNFLDNAIWNYDSVAYLGIYSYKVTNQDF